MGQAVTILSAADAGISAGAGWWVALLAAAREAVPSAEFSTILDCGDDAGAAQAALRAGVEAIVFTGRTDVAARLAEVAAASGARLLAARPATEIDLAAEFFADAATLRRRCLGAFDPQKTWDR
jgi:hypothetical protein